MDMNYAKMTENGKAEFARPTRTVSEDGLTITYTMKSEAELQELGYKKVYSYVSGSPAKGMKLVISYEDKGDFILRTSSWTAK